MDKDRAPWWKCIAATAWNAIGRREAALAVYREILESEPDHSTALYYVLRSCRERARVAEVLEIAQRALDRDPGDFGALDALAWAHITQGDHRRAKVVVHRALGSLAHLESTKDRTLSRIPGWLLWTLRVATTALSLFPTKLPRGDPRVVLARNLAREMRQWRAWAREYLAWCETKAGPGPSGAVH